MFKKYGKYLLLLVLMFAAMPLAVSRAQEDHGSLGMARVTYIQGDALFNSPDTDEWAALSPNFTLRDEDRLWAGEDSKMEVTFADGHVAWLNDTSELDMVRLSRDPAGDVYQVALATGEGSFSVRRPRGEGSMFQVDTAISSVRVYRRAMFRVSALSDGTTQVGVSRGQVEVETEDGITTINRGEMAEIDRDGYVDITSLPPDDSWDRWVASRASRYDRPARSARYLPDDMDSYAYEFDEGGRWTSTPDYGNVWVPTIVAPGWSPYSNGRWVWIGGDYVWLPYDPWYAPFHYGRWNWSISIGWCWIPPLTPRAYWSPGYVGWVWGADVVSWVPLAPREVYYGYGNYGPHSVNIYKTKVVNITNVYINSKVNNGVVVVRKDHFVRGDTSRVAIRDKSQNPFTSRDRGKFKLIGRPPVEELRPTRETRLPKPNIKLERKALPPQKFERPATFIKERKAAKAPKESAFKPGRAPMDLKKLDRVNVPRESRRQKEPRFREEKPRIEKGPGTVIQPGAPKKEQAPDRDRRMERDRSLAPAPAPSIEKDTRKPRRQEEAAPPSGPITRTPGQDRGVSRGPRVAPDEDRRALPRDRKIKKDTGKDVVPPTRTTAPPQQRLEGGRPEKRIERGAPEQAPREPGFRRDRPRRAGQEQDLRQKQKKLKEEKEKIEKKGDKDKEEEAPR
jgi:hypothetical protein